VSKNIVRYLEDPPSEQFEATWRDAKQILESAGPKAGFILLVANDNGGSYSTAFVISSGEDRIKASALSYLVKNWLDSE
jgi:hypothetical protein